MKIKRRKLNLTPVYGTGFLLCFFGLPFLLPVFLAKCATNRETQYKYLVTDKADNKIVFEDVAAQHTQRVMTFDIADSTYYRSINIGDTIGCAKQFTDTQLVVPVHDAEIRLISRGDILRMLELQQQTARRDSIIANMKTKQK